MLISPDFRHRIATVAAQEAPSRFRLPGVVTDIVASLSPEKNMAFMRLMIPTIDPAERAILLGAMQKGAPPEVFSAVIEFAVRPGLSEKAFGDLANRLQLAA